MDGTATTSEKRRGTVREKEGTRGGEKRGSETTTGMNRGGKRERKRTVREETSWRGDKEVRHEGVKLMQMMTLGVLQRHNAGRKINNIF